jgi:hypothetical protein
MFTLKFPVAICPTRPGPLALADLNAAIVAHANPPMNIKAIDEKTVGLII